MRQDEKTITGYILATDFDRHGKIIEISIETDDFIQYRILTNRKSRELMNHILSKVIIHGYQVGEDLQGKSILDVDHYEIKNECSDYTMY